MATIAELFARALRHHQSGELRQAEPLYRQILLADPYHADAHHNLGLLAQQTGYAEAAVALMRRAIALNPSVAVYHANLGRALRQHGERTEAIASYRQALQLDPNDVDALKDLGLAHKDQGELDEAAMCFRQALRSSPNQEDVHNNLGNVLKNLGRLDEAVACFREALRLKPGYASAYNNLGVALALQGQMEEAGACFRQAVLLEPQFASARFNSSLLWILRGDFQRAWSDYEYRWENNGLVRRHEDRPRWDGSPLQGKTILVYAELGLGDTIWFIRYAPLVKQRGGTVLFECQPALRDLLEGVAGVDRLLVEGEPLPAYDVQTALLSLPGLLETRLETIPAQIPYLRARSERVEHWRKELEPLDGFKVGIVWQGSPTYRGDRQRSIPLRHYAPLARVKGVRLVSLQKGPGANQLRTLAEPFPVLDLGPQLETFSETAAVLKNLDLLISSCTSVPHLAGALGVPVWLALSLPADCRWLLDREDSPWYPYHRLFRQSRWGDWGGVFERIAIELHSLIATRTGR